jgi:predicted amidohydrolase YtcJ
MGAEHETGSLEPGKWADFAVVEALPDGSDPGLAVLEAAAGGGVAATVAGGDVIYNRTEA